MEFFLQPASAMACQGRSKSRRTCVSGVMSFSTSAAQALLTVSLYYLYAPANVERNYQSGPRSLHCNNAQARRRVKNQICEPPLHCPPATCKDSFPRTRRKATVMWHTQRRQIRREPGLSDARVYGAFAALVGLDWKDNWSIGKRDCRCNRGQGPLHQQFRFFVPAAKCMRRLQDQTQPAVPRVGPTLRLTDATNGPTRFGRRRDGGHMHSGWLVTVWEDLETTYGTI